MLSNARDIRSVVGLIFYPTPTTTQHTKKDLWYLGVVFAKCSFCFEYGKESLVSLERI